MSKEELSKWYGKASPAYYDQEDLENAMVAAYNKAIDDALELYYNPTSTEDQDTFDKDLESLRI